MKFVSTTSTTALLLLLPGAVTSASNLRGKRNLQRSKDYGNGSTALYQPSSTSSSYIGSTVSTITSTSTSKYGFGDSGGSGGRGNGASGGSSGGRGNGNTMKSSGGGGSGRGDYDVGTTIKYSDLISRPSGSGSGKNSKCGHEHSVSKQSSSLSGFRPSGSSKDGGSSKTTGSSRDSSKASGASSKDSSGYSKSSSSGGGSRSDYKYDFGSGGSRSGRSYRTAHSNRKYDSSRSSAQCDLLNLDLRPNNDIMRTPMNTPVSNTQIFVLSNDVNNNRSNPNSILEVVSYSQPRNGALQITDTGFTYTPDNGFVGLDTIDYAISDGVNPGVNTATIGILVGNTGNIAPVLEDDTYDAMVGEPLTVSCAELLQNDYDWNGDRLTITGYSNPLNGNLRRNNRNNNCGFVYTPDADFIGEDTVEYTVIDGNGGESTATITIYVKYPNLPPVAVDDFLDLDDADTFEFSPALIMSNDNDPEGFDLVVIDFSEPPRGQGLLTRTNDGTFVYLAQGFSGRTSFLYTVADPDGGTAAATVYLDVAAGNRAPQASDDAYTTPVNTQLDVAAPGVLRNDQDPDGDALTVESATEPQFGTLRRINGDGSLRYQPDQDFEGVDVFTYTVSDGRGGERTAVVTIEVGNPNNRAPQAVDDRYVVPMNSAGENLYVLNNDVDRDGDFLVITDAPLGPSHGDLGEDRNGRFLIYTPDPGFSGRDTFTYAVSDGKGGSATAVVVIEVVDNNPAAANNVVAVNDFYQAAKNQLLTVSSPGLLRNDRYTGGVSVSRLSPPQFGQLTLNRDGSFSYMPALNYAGTDKFMYTVVDSNNSVDTATVTIQVRQSVVPPLVTPGGGNTIIVGVQGKSNDCKLGFSDCTGVNTISNTIKIQDSP